VQSHTSEISEFPDFTFSAFYILQMSSLTQFQNSRFRNLLTFYERLHSDFAMSLVFTFWHSPNSKVLQVVCFMFHGSHGIPFSKVSAFTVFNLPHSVFSAFQILQFSLFWIFCVQRVRFSKIMIVRHPHLLVVSFWDLWLADIMTLIFQNLDGRFSEL
jgi:hypothetical protein